MLTFKASNCLSPHIVSHVTGCCFCLFDVGHWPCVPLPESGVPSMCPVPPMQKLLCCTIQLSPSSQCLCEGWRCQWGPWPLPTLFRMRGTVFFLLGDSAGREERCNSLLQNHETYRKKNLFFVLLPTRDGRMSLNHWYDCMCYEWNADQGMKDSHSVPRLRQLQHIPVAGGCSWEAMNEAQPLAQASSGLHCFGTAAWHIGCQLSSATLAKGSRAASYLRKHPAALSQLSIALPRVCFLLLMWNLPLQGQKQSHSPGEEKKSLAINHELLWRKF